MSDEPSAQARPPGGWLIIVGGILAAWGGFILIASGKFAPAPVVVFVVGLAALAVGLIIRGR